MTRLGFALSMIAVVATAAWAYHVNYRTKTAFGRVDLLRNQIAAEREAVEVLRVEWAYLNSPDRLARLVELTNDRLGLAPIGPQQFDEAAAIPFPPRTPGPVPDDAGPEAEAETVVVISEPVPPVSVPVPLPRPARWRLE
ncbi:MAG: cell division protein FtsL [Paracoccaceae bacterium]